MRIGLVIAAVGGLSCIAMQARAGLTISTGATSHMKCSAGVCSPTANTAVLNVGDLENLLASGSIVVTTTGSSVQAKDILVTAPLTWSTANALTLDAYHSLTIEGAVSVAGAGGVSLLTNDGGSGGTLSFGNGGDIAFSTLSSALSINGASYTLVNSVSLLATDIASNPSGKFAFAQNYDASGDGTYAASPIGTQFGGTFEGLGNTISNLSVNDTATGDRVGLFAFVATGSVFDLGLDNASVAGPNGSHVGGIAGTLGSGTIQGSRVSGAVSGATQCYATGGIAGDTANGTITASSSSAAVSCGGVGGDVGGLVGSSGSAITDSYATGNVTGGTDQYVGGLVGVSSGTVSLSFATGSVTGSGSSIGGLEGRNQGTIGNSYAMGAVADNSGGSGSDLGGLVGYDDSAVGDSWSSGKVTQSGTGDTLGGLIGYDASGGMFKHDYWDRSTSKIKNKSQGAGNIANDVGIKGLKNTQFIAGLPKGFSSKVWAESSTINKGLPYLISNPPP